jgi:hypothetical protein
MSKLNQKTTEPEDLTEYSSFEPVSLVLPH